MTNIEEQLGVALKRRAESVVVRDDLESIFDGTNVVRFTDPTARPRRRPQLLLVAAAGLVAVIGGLLWAQSIQNEPAATTEQPPGEPSLPPVPGGGSAALWDLPPSASADRIDAYPIVDDLPDSAYGSFGNRTDQDTWIGSIGALRPDGVPQPLVAVSTFPKGQEPFPDAAPGRAEGVSEIYGDGRYTLAWTIDETPMTLTGADLDTMYSLVEHVAPSADGADRGGYSITGDLPLGLVELATPYELRPMVLPEITSESGEFSVAIDDGPFLSVMAATGVVEREPITIGSLSGFILVGDRPLIALALSGDEIMFVSSTTMSREQLIDFAGTIRIGDEAEFRSTYRLTD